MKTRTKVLIGLGVYFGLTILVLVVFGNAGTCFRPSLCLQPAFPPVRIDDADWGRLIAQHSPPRRRTSNAVAQLGDFELERR